MYASAIKSRPQYRGLQAVAEARRNLIAAEGAGVAALARMLAEAPPGFVARTDLLVVGEAGELEAAGCRSCRAHASIDAALVALDRELAVATMGTRLYAAGTEGFVARVVRLGIDHGIDHRSVVTEHSGSFARRVQCVHCKGFTEGVTASIFECGHCGVLLFVRDHFSRRLAAFQGVCVNAEDMSQRPAGEEIYR